MSTSLVDLQIIHKVQIMYRYSNIFYKKIMTKSIFQLKKKEREQTRSSYISQKVIPQKAAIENKESSHGGGEYLIYIYSSRSATPIIQHLVSSRRGPCPRARARARMLHTYTIHIHMRTHG